MTLAVSENGTQLAPEHLANVAKLAALFQRKR